MEKGEEAVGRQSLRLGEALRKSVCQQVPIEEAHLAEMVRPGNPVAGALAGSYLGSEWSVFEHPGGSQRHSS